MRAMGIIYVCKRASVVNSQAAAATHVLMCLSLVIRRRSRLSLLGNICPTASPDRDVPVCPFLGYI
jgi:hypothetical protein